ncbi:FaeA/PapI family transcriptional regulator [Escherichia coli]|nr:regulator [Escherichia coli]MDD8641649.1 FaeA/PapI family transcriptional regulator [Escherichia coli]MDD8882554.1 FaeA/PapI family transcriptional regulator [Escherichia coli]
MNKNIAENIISFMEEQRKSAGRTFFSSREIAGAVSLTVHQVRTGLEMLQAAGVVEKVKVRGENAWRWYLF